ncbi:MAG: hemerythrin domain-containing protein [Puia sp.]|nr:hemerythrin domain-containing protein [Puia sp.]
MPENSDFFPQVMQRYTIHPALTGINKEFIAELLRAFEEKPFCASAFDPFPVDLIVDYIQRTHVFYLQKKLPEIEQSIFLLSGLYTSHHPILAALQNFFQRYCRDLTAHIRAEETELLPYIVLLQRASGASDALSEFILTRQRYSISAFLADHHDTEDELKDIRQTIGLYEPPTTNASLYRILITQLQTFEQDLRVHALIEDQVLIPKSLQLEAGLNQLLSKTAGSN